MFKIIAVDDEPSALSRFERISAMDNRLEPMQSFTKPHDAISYVKANPVDIAFLDIEMPDMSGLELAEILMDINPYIEVVFVTAYNQYALEAFRAHATGYLLKPLSKEDFTAQIDTMQKKLSKDRHAASDKLIVSCLGSFTVRKMPSDTEGIKFRTTKAEELLAFLIYNQGRPRSKDLILDTLWPDADLDKAANNFRVTCTYIRSTLADLGYTEVLLRDHDDYSINTSKINCDYFEFRNRIANIDALSLDDVNHLLSLYKGPFLENRFYDWADEMKGWLEGRYMQLLYHSADLYESSGNTSKAIDSYENILRIDLYEEAAVKKVLELKKKTLPSSALKEYCKKYSDSLFKEYGSEPSRELREVFRSF